MESRLQKLEDNEDRHHMQINKHDMQIKDIFKRLRKLEVIAARISYLENKFSSLKKREEALQHKLTQTRRTLMARTLDNRRKVQSLITRVKRLSWERVLSEMEGRNGLSEMGG